MSSKIVRSSTYLSLKSACTQLALSLHWFRYSSTPSRVPWGPPSLYYICSDEQVYADFLLETPSGYISN